MSAKRRRIGHVQELSSGRFRAIIERGTKADGSRRVMSKTLDTRDQADGWLLAQAVELGSREDLGAGITLAQVWESYKTRDDLARKTLKSYQWLMESIWIPRFGDMDVSALRAQDVQGVIDTLSYGNAQHAKAALSSVLTYAHRVGVLDKHPLSGYRFSYPKNDVDIDDDEDPFAAIDDRRDVWDVSTVLRCFELIRGLPLEPAWLACVGAGLRVEEALALRRRDIRRVAVGLREVTQLAVHAARTQLDERKSTKTRQSVRVVAMLEPFGARLWEIASDISDKSALLCPVSAVNQNKRWKGYFDAPPTSKHTPKDAGFVHKGRLHELPYLPLSKMRNTHITIMSEAGLSDSVNALLHGHSQMVERKHYLSPDLTRAVLDVKI